MKKEARSLKQEVTEEIRKILDDMDKFAENGNMEGLIILGRIRTGKHETQTIWKFAGLSVGEVVYQIESVKTGLLLKHLNLEAGHKVQPPERKH